MVADNFFRGWPQHNITAIFQEAPGGGNTRDINSPRNAPAKTPKSHLSRVFWHSSFFQFELVAPVLTKVVTHTALAGKQRWSGIDLNNNLINNVTTKPTVLGAFIESRGDVRVTDIVLMTHNLGYVPLYFIAHAGRVLCNGLNIQSLASGQMRTVSAFATSSVIGIRETAISADVALPAISKTYEVMAFRSPAANAGKAMWSFDGDAMLLGRGIVDSRKEYVRSVLSSESSFDIDLGRTMDIKNGRTRYSSGGIVTTEPDYNGSFAGSPYKAIGV